jgi:hypothetical protein
MSTKEAEVMSIEINGECYLTVTEAAFVLKTTASMMAHYIYRSEFRGIIDTNSSDPLIAALAKHRIDLDEEEYAKLLNRNRAVMLIPFSSVLDKMVRRKERRMTAKIRKQQKLQKLQDKESRVHPAREEGMGAGI